MKHEQGAPGLTDSFQHLLVTGGCGFIGSNFVRYALTSGLSLCVTNVDALTYSGNPLNLADVVERNGPGGDSRYQFVHADITDQDFMLNLIQKSLCADDRPPIDAVIHFAAESHVDRSIIGPIPFVRTNVLGTAVLIEICQRMRNELPACFRFIQISTDEVYGSLEPSDPPFDEATALAPNSPYAASKASSDLLVRSYCNTFDFPAIITRCSNNYGPFQYPEKLVPLMITTAMRDESLPVYGDGMNVRDWVHVHDHCAAIWSVLQNGHVGACYNIGGEAELTNLDIVKSVTSALGKPESLITFVADRPGHDRRYAMNIDRIRNDLGWYPSISFDSGIHTTIDWYLQHEAWWRPLLVDSEFVMNKMYKT